jgi:hypothetical protein
MRFSTIDTFHATPQRWQARLLHVGFMERATHLDEKREG